MMVSRRLILGFGLTASFLLPSWVESGLAEAVSLSLPLPPQPPRRRVPPLIMLDPGHGGSDPGAIGVAGTYEKIIALAAAYDLKRRIEASGRYEVALTRYGDVFIPLETRVAIAQKHRAALFVSMHADSIEEHWIRGASVYTLSSSASDAQTAELAQSENAADRFAGPSFKGVPPQVAEILASLVARETIIGSRRLAQEIVRELGRTELLLPNPSRHAAFVVLKSAEIPSVLVEMGFMSNQNDEAELRLDVQRQRIAAALLNAIDAWFAAHTLADMAG